MNQADMIVAIANDSGISKKDVQAVLNSQALVVHAELSHSGEVTLPHLGKLSVQRKEARTGRNPKTGESLEIPAKNVPKFSAAKALKDAVA